MSREMISVIVCTYNQQDTIGRTLDSILAQQCHLPIEIVIGEDCSADNTLAICREYERKHPHVVRILANTSNKGFVRNYFDCLRACRGKFVADCSGDDFWIDETKLEQQSVILEKDENVGIVHADWLRYDEMTGEMTPPHGSPIKERWEENILMPAERPAIHLCTSLYRRDWILQDMHDYPQFFNPDTYFCEDVQIAFFLAHKGRVAYIEKPMLAYSCGGTTLSNPDSEEKQFRFWANTTRLSCDLAHAFNIRSKDIDRFLQSRLHKLLMHAFRSGNPSLRKEASRMQKEMNIPCNRQILLAKLITLPLVWQAMLPVRNLFVRMKH